MPLSFDDLQVGDLVRRKLAYYDEIRYYIVASESVIFLLYPEQGRMALDLLGWTDLTNAEIVTRDAWSDPDHIMTAQIKRWERQELRASGDPLPTVQVVEDGMDRATGRRQYIAKWGNHAE